MSNILTLPYVLDRLADIHGDRFDLNFVEEDWGLRNGIGVRLRCRICGYTFYRTMSVIFKEVGCAQCVYRDQGPSKGEADILQWLTRHSIPFEYQMLIPSLGLVFDFWVPKHNLFIEYDGCQHYKFVEYFHRTEREFEKAKCRDEAKDDWCERNGYALLRIRYDQDIETELSRIFTQA